MQVVTTEEWDSVLHGMHAAAGLAGVLYVLCFFLVVNICMLSLMVALTINSFLAAKGDLLGSGQRASRWKGPGTLSEHSAPSARLVVPRVQTAPMHPRSTPGAPPRPLGSSPWPQELASGRFKWGFCTLSTGRLVDLAEGSAAGRRASARRRSFAAAGRRSGVRGSVYASRHNSQLITGGIDGSRLANNLSLAVQSMKGQMAMSVRLPALA